MQEAIWKLEYGASFTPAFTGGTEAQNAYNFYLSDAAGKNEAVAYLDPTLGGQLTPPLTAQGLLATEEYNFGNTPKASPTITTTVSASTDVVGTPIHDSATVSGGNNPTGTVTFALYSSATTQNASTLVYTDPTNEPLSNGTATSASYTPTATGTYYGSPPTTATATITSKLAGPAPKR